MEREPDPLPSRVLVAPVVAAAADPREREGTIETGRNEAESQGSGAGGGAGTGQGTGNGEGLGSGIGDGAGGGTGGGPYRPGSGIDAATPAARGEGGLHGRRSAARPAR